MASKKKKHWNILAVVSILLAGLLALTGINKLDVGRVPSRDALRLSSASRALTTDRRRLLGDSWTSLRGEKLTGQEMALDQRSGRGHTRSGRDLRQQHLRPCLGVPSCSSNGYVWLPGEDLQRYLVNRTKRLNRESPW